MSSQCDIVLYDAVNNAPLYKSETWSIYPIEIVYGIIEVKTNLKRSELDDAFAKCKEIRSMAKTAGKSYALPSSKGPGSYQVTLAPRYFIFSYGGWKTMQALAKNFVAVSDEHPEAHLHGVCSLLKRDSFLIWHNAFKTGEERIGFVKKNGFQRFLMNLPTLLNSMLPPHRAGLGFDQFDLDHYSLALHQTVESASHPVKRQ